MYKIFFSFALLSTLFLQASEILPSWNEGSSKSSIIKYVNSVTNEKNKDFIPKVDRIAVFDNDGTLWSEQPAYFQLFFAMDRVKALSSSTPRVGNNPTIQSSA